MEIEPHRPSTKNLPEQFAGEVRLDPIALPHEGDERMVVAAVRFASGARTAWHFHARDVDRPTGLPGLTLFPCTWFVGSRGTTWVPPASPLLESRHQGGDPAGRGRLTRRREDRVQRRVAGCAAQLREGRLGGG